MPSRYLLKYEGRHYNVLINNLPKKHGHKLFQKSKFNSVWVITGNGREIIAGNTIPLLFLIYSTSKNKFDSNPILLTIMYILRRHSSKIKHFHLILQLLGPTVWSFATAFSLKWNISSWFQPSITHTLHSVYQKKSHVRTDGTSITKCWKNTTSQDPHSEVDW